MDVCHSMYCSVANELKSPHNHNLFGSMLRIGFILNNSVHSLVRTAVNHLTWNYPTNVPYRSKASLVIQGFCRIIEQVVMA